jgi:hypothetical protein
LLACVSVTDIPWHLCQCSFAGTAISCPGNMFMLVCCVLLPCRAADNLRQNTVAGNIKRKLGQLPPEKASRLPRYEAFVELQTGLGRAQGNAITKVLQGCPAGEDLATVELPSFHEVSQFKFMRANCATVLSAYQGTCIVGWPVSW